MLVALADRCIQSSPSLLPLNTPLGCKTRRCVHYVFALMTVVACSPPEEVADTKLKQSVVGTWLVEYKTPSEQSVRRTITLGADGNHVEVERLGDVETRYSGPWYVTDGLLKLNGQKINGQSVGVTWGQGPYNYVRAPAP